jgi:hypothetical protein
MTKLFAPRRISRANDVDALIPEFWAREGIALLTENMQISRTIHRDFEMEFARFGDTVNTRQPSNFVAARKNKGSNVVAQDAVTTNIPVVLNQHCYVSFLLDDQDLTLAMEDLVSYFLNPAAIALARLVDQVCLSQVWQFAGSGIVGSLSGLTNANGLQLLAKTRGELNGQLVPDDGNRWLALGTEADSLMMQNAIFTQADQRGDQQGLINGYLGTKMNLNCYMSQNVPYLLAGSVGTGEVDLLAGYGIGDTVLVVDGFADQEVLPNDWISINGIPYLVSATNAGVATQITLAWGLKAAVANNDDILVYGRAAVNLVAGYSAGHSEALVVNGATQTIQVGQVLTFGTSATKYVVVQTNGTTSITLDRPLEDAQAHATVIHLGPAGGGFNFAYHRNCMTLALRPLAAPRAGAASVVTSWNDVPLRVVITYDGQAQKHRVTLDFLAGVKVLDDDLGCLVLS